MIQYAEAVQRVRAIAHKKISDRVETVSLDDSLDRVAGADVLSQVQLPAFASSTADGFAVKSSETQKATQQSPVKLRVLGSIAAGDTSPDHSQDAGFWEIMTGASLPKDFDAVIKWADAQVVSKDRQGNPTEIEITHVALAGQNRRAAGEDFDIGAKVLSRGQIIQPEHLMALSSISCSEVSVASRPRVAIVSTGRELVALNAPMKPGQIRNSTRHFLTASAKKWGAEACFYGMTGDQPEDFSAMIEHILKHKPDLIITTGAVSAGKHDFVAQALQALGAETIFHKVAIRPGKPILFAQFKSGPAVFGLPGNPVATVVGWRFFIEPYLRVLMGLKAEAPLRAQLPQQPEHAEGVRCFYKARLGDNLNEVKVLNEQMSFRVSPLLDANAWAVIPENALGSDLTVDVYPFQSSGNSL